MSKIELSIRSLWIAHRLARATIRWGSQAGDRSACRLGDARRWVFGGHEKEMKKKKKIRTYRVESRCACASSRAKRRETKVRTWCRIWVGTARSRALEVECAIPISKRPLRPPVNRYESYTLHRYISTAMSGEERDHAARRIWPPKIMENFGSNGPLNELHCPQ